MEAQFAAAGDLTWPMSGDRHFHVWQLPKRLCLINLFLPYLGLSSIDHSNRIHQKRQKSDLIGDIETIGREWT
jgi:hypothetical protein